MRMFSEEDKGVVFFETVLSIRAQRHTYIECVPVPWEHFEQLPGYYKVCMRSTAAKSQLKHLCAAGIDIDV